MKPRTYFLLTAFSGMIGMLALIATSLFKSRISKISLENLSDESIDQIHFAATGTFVSLVVSQIAVAAFVVFLVLYLVAKNRSLAPR